MTISVRGALRAAALPTLLTALCATVAAAQGIPTPPRSTSGLLGGAEAVEPNRTRQALDLTLDLLGGYDDNLQPPGQNIANNPFAVQQGGLTGSFAAGVNYRRARTARGIEASGRAFVNAFHNLDAQTLIGGQGNVRAFSRVGSRTLVSVLAGGDYQPTFMFGTFGAPAVDGAAPPSDPTLGAIENRSVNANGAATLNQEWSVRQRTNMALSYGRTRLYGLSDSTMEHRRLTLGHGWDFARNMGVAANYDLSHDTGADARGTTAPVDTHALTMRLDLRRPISRTRRMTFAVGSGVMRVEAVSSVDNSIIDYYAPSALGLVRMDLGRTWAVSADVRRDVSRLIGVTEQSFLTSIGTLWAGGNIGSRMVLSISGSYTVGSPHEGETGSYTSTSGTTTAQYRVSRCCSLLGSYSYYDHRIRDLAAVPLGYPSTFERNAVRGGVTLWLPLYGTFPAERRQ